MSETIEWVDPDSTVIPLNVERKTQNRFSPPNRFVIDESPTVDGAVMRSVRHTARRVILPIVIKGDSPGDVRTQIEDLTYALDPKRGPGKIRVTGPNGIVRESVAYLEDGMGLDETLNSAAGPLWQRASLQFFCPEPYWKDATTTSGVENYDSDTPTFFPFFPLRLVSSSIFGTATILNDGHVETYPRWQVTGPGSAIYLKNLSTGEYISLDVSLAAGETVSIDTTPGVRSITKNDGTNLFGQLSADSTLWALRQGSNSIQMEMSSADSTSSFSYSYERRWLSA